jgi:hypothetical protein
MEASKHMITHTPKFRDHEHLIEWSATHDYEYGQNDCFTFPFMWHDIRFDTDKVNLIKGKYKSDYSAKKFFKNFVKTTTWLSHNGYTEVVKNKRKLEDHDIVVVELAGWDMVWVHSGGFLYFRHHDKLYKVKPNKVKATSIWRK